MTNEDWKETEAKLSVPFGRVKLNIDDYNVTIATVPTKNPLKYELAVFIDGKFDYAWCTEDCEIRRRFCSMHKKSLLSAKQRNKLKKERKAFREEVEKQMTVYIYYPYWNSFRSLRSHLIRNNTSINLLEDVQSEIKEEILYEI